MKRPIALLLTLTLSLSLWGCVPGGLSAEESTAGTAAETQAEILTGWQQLDDGKYCFAEDGSPVTGWLSDPAEENGRCYLDDRGRAVTGWQEIDGKRYYFGGDGIMTTGWLEEDGEHYYFGIDGAMFTGILNIQGKGYYFDEAGRRRSGWQQQNGYTYYFDEAGVMAVGQVELEGQIHHFSPHGVKIMLVNPWNTLPGDYQVELEQVTNRDRLEKDCAEALRRMLEDCVAAGHDPYIVSAYRTQEEQEYLYWRKVNRLKEAGWGHNQALTEAAKEVAVPGTSEHQLGLAVDILDEDYPYLDSYQANTGTQKWLMEHCYSYGFILRYPVDSTDITGIIYEPWHYRYVGVEIAQEIMNLGITLEEYLGAAQRQ